MQALPQTSGLFPHRMVQDPRGFLLPRFVNVGRHLMAANVVLRPTSKNLQVSGRSLQVHARHGKKVVADIQMMLRPHVSAAIGIDER